ncbi:GNAT family N-acetyltransferase [Roseinatronobacter alkalisoli]|uniref:GNAT family N-acetyltransferase n=1 Tax=Roseinatronobacter alkalisoli TaxID=3028235 RepID=A0ABT5TBS1_9RHOB|nr:GNAT family N-acetyltransferase [Roseinatronobacter sp. HJB301]MDD7972567.1 GNAT family N-acetyltransferase [Roseinatronobacter sp. HJB301]
MDGGALSVTLVPDLGHVSPQDWDSCACPEAASGRPSDPFTTYRFLRALETSGSVGGNTGWEPRHLIVHAGAQVVAVAPMYVKSHSQGEYIFDHAFAQAYQRAGGDYYPKLQVAVPFTPATGRRLLTAPDTGDAGHAALLQALAQIARDNGLSSAHVTFCTEDEAETGAQYGFLPRVTEQFHWENRAYAGFDDFLADLSSRKRKSIRKERAQAQGFGGDIRQYTGADIRPAHWDAFWSFYQDTGARKWGIPYLTRAFFDHIHDTMRNDILLVLAERDGQPVAGALNFIGRDGLFGRYWGCVEDHPCLHFELCYYQAMDYAIVNGLRRVEAGAQGIHKLARGYMPSRVHSLHYFPQPGFHDAVARYLADETQAISDEMDVLRDHAPFRKHP